MNDLFFVLFLFFLAGTGIYMWQRFKKNKQLEKADTPPAGSIELNLENVQAGGMIRLLNVGRQLEEYDVNILSRNIYREGESHEWYELEGDNGRKKIWISLDYDDELDVNIATRKLKLRELPINREDLDRMDEQKKGEFVFEGKTYHFERSNEASFFRNGDTRQENEAFFYYWEFETDSGDEFLTVEEWENGQFDVTLSYPVKESQVKVYSLGH